jgi:hypothetical protein
MNLRCACRIAPLLLALAAVAEPMPVHRTQGLIHGFLNIRSATGAILGYGEVSQFATGDRVTSRTTLHFRDGSLDDETAIFTQSGVFRFVSDHHIQRGPFFKNAIDALVESSGNVTIRTTGKDGKVKEETSHIDLPPDISNGLVGPVLESLPRDAPAFTLGLVLPTAKGRLIRLNIVPDGTASFTAIPGARRTANLFRIKLVLGGLAGAIAPMIGKQPADSIIWVLEGDAPVIVREDTRLAEDTPIVSLELAGASFPRATP